MPTSLVFECQKPGAMAAGVVAYAPVCASFAFEGGIELTSTGAIGEPLFIAVAALLSVRVIVFWQGSADLPKFIVKLH